MINKAKPDARTDAGVELPFVNAIRVLCLAVVLLMAGCSQSESVSTQLDQAATAFQAQNYRVAEIRAKAALRDAPDNSRGWLLLARTSLATRRYADAVHQFDKAADTGTPQADIVLPLAQSLLGDGQNQRALDLLADASPESTADQATVAVVKGRAYLNLQNRDAASSAFAQALTLESNNASALVGQASLAMQDDDVAGARSLIGQALQSQPDDPEARIAMARLDYGQNRCEPAAASLSDVLTGKSAAISGGERFQLTAFLADCQLRLGRTEAASQNIDKLIDASPNNPYANYLKGLLSMRSGDNTSAKASLQRVLNVDSDNARTMTLLAALALSEGDNETARRYLERVLARNPQDVGALRLRTGLLLQADDTDQALDMLESAYRGNSNADVRALLVDVLARVDANEPQTIESAVVAANDAPLQLDLAAALARNGKFEQARRVLDAVDSDDDDMRQRKAMTGVAIDMADGRSSRAVDAARSLAKAYPGSAAVQQLLARVLAASGQPDEAATVLTKAIDAAPDNQALAFDKARLSMQTGNYEAAADQFKTLLKTSPGNAQLTLALATAYARAGRQDDMLALLEKARSDSPDDVSIGAALVNAYLGADKPGEALALAEQLRKANPKNAALLRLRGIAELADDQEQKGLATLGEAADLASSDPAYRMDLTQALLAKGKTKEAAAQASQILERFADYAPAIRLLALAQQRSGDLDAALASAGRLEDSGGTMAARLKGEINMNAQRYRDAADAFAAAYDVSPDPATALALFEARRRADMPDAGQTLVDAMNTSGWNRTLAVRLAQWYQATGDAKAAAQAYERILAQTPNDPVVLNNLAVIYDDTQDERALVLAQRAHSAAPGNPQIADTLGWIKVRKDKPSEGVVLLRQAVKDTDGDPTIVYHLAYGLAESGGSENVQEAREIIAAVLEKNAEFADREAALELLKNLPADESSKAS